MWKYYFSVVRGIPSTFRATVEGVLFWVFSVSVPILIFLSPQLKKMLDTPDLSRWLALVPIGVSVVYGALRVNYKRYETQRNVAETSMAQAEQLRATLRRKECCLDVTDPAFWNMRRVIEAFEVLRYDTQQPRPEVWITAPKDMSSLAAAVAQLASIGSRCVVNGPLDVGIDPDVERITLDGMEPNMVILHVAREHPLGDRLFTDLSNVFRLKRSYLLMPRASHGNTVWLQLGPGLQWNTER